MKWRLKVNEVEAVRYGASGIVSAKGAVLSVERGWWMVSGPKGARYALTDEEFLAGFERIEEEKEGESIE